VAALSARTLIMLAAVDESFDHEGRSPHRISDNYRMGSFRILADDGRVFSVEFVSHSAMLTRAARSPAKLNWKARGPCSLDST
jgi:hypothetical protein